VQDRRESVLRRLGPVEVPSSHVLRSLDDVEAARAAAVALGLAPNPVAIKSWDNVLAVRIIVALYPERDAPIVDLGCRSGILLTWLDQLGYRRLHGCDLRQPAPPVRAALKGGLWQTVAAGTTTYLRHRRRLVKASVEDTGLPAGGFAVAASMSVIEHGVDLPRFFAEAARLLRPGGTLIVSTDYWPSAIDVGGLRRFQVSRSSDRIFDRTEVARLGDIARSAGFIGPATLDMETGNPVVSSSGFSYTFLLLSFRRANYARGQV
jgi:SAM-dependent methyltransferase